MKDIKRTYQESPIFKKEEIQEMMLRILYIYAKKNSYISYKQGMNELLAIILNLFLQSKEEFKNLQVKNETIDYLMDQEFLEHDVFTVFVALMDKTSKWFEDKPQIPIRQGNSPKTQEEELIDPSFYLPISLQCNNIQNVILRKYDQELFEHLKKFSIYPQIYMLRWIRLLFARQSSLETIYYIWDAILAYCPNDKTLNFVDYISVAILEKIRSNGDLFFLFYTIFYI